MNLPIIAITQGDALGIGPEIIGKALEKRALHEICRPIVIADPGLLRLPKKLSHVPIVDPARRKYKNSSFGALEKATALCLQKKISAIVTAPVNKQQISDDECITFTGHTEYLSRKASLFYKKDFHPTMLFVGKEERLALATTHIPLQDVSKTITPLLLKKTINNINDGLRIWFGIRKPKIALLGINPHAGEAGKIGIEEVHIFKKIIAWAQRKKIALNGPFSADSFFSKRWQDFDVTLAMYHDQGLAPFKLRNYPKSVNVTLGLPIIRTSVDHGVGYDIARKGIADASSMISAIQLAARLSSRAQ